MGKEKNKNLKRFGLIFVVILTLILPGSIAIAAIEKSTYIDNSVVKSSINLVSNEKEDGSSLTEEKDSNINIEETNSPEEVYRSSNIYVDLEKSNNNNEETKKVDGIYQKTEENVKYIKGSIFAKLLSYIRREDTTMKIINTTEEEVEFVALHTLFVRVLILDDSPDDYNMSGYEEITGIPTSVNVYLFHSDPLLSGGTFELIDQMNVTKPFPEPEDWYYGCKNISWAGNGTLCVGYEPTNIINGKSVDEVQIIGGLTFAVVHHWICNIGICEYDVVEDAEKISADTENGEVEFVALHTLFVRVLILDDSPDDYNMSGYEEITGIPTSVNVYLFHSDPLLSGGTFELIDQMNVTKPFPEPEDWYYGCKNISWAGNGTLCVGYEPTNIINGKSVDEVQIIGGLTFAVVHHWICNIGILFGHTITID